MKLGGVKILLVLLQSLFLQHTHLAISHNQTIVRISFRIFQILEGKWEWKWLQRKICSLGQGFNLSGKPLKNWGHETGWREQSVRVKMVECDVEKWADGAIQVVYSRAEWRKRLCAGNRAPLLETISLLPVNTLLTRTQSSCPLQRNKKLASITCSLSFGMFQMQGNPRLSFHNCAHEARKRSDI